VRGGRLEDDAAFHIEQAISSVADAIGRVIDGIEVLNLDKITSGRTCLNEAESSLVMAIRCRRVAEESSGADKG
jgi:hypothetical protein